MDNKDRTDGSCWWSIIIIGLLIWGVWKLWDNHYSSQKKPFWSGTEELQVCKTPYYSSGDCYKLKVTLIDKGNARINFNNGGYKYVRNLQCWYAGNLDDKTPRYIFCRSRDRDGQQWDIMPSWVNY